MDNNKDSSSFFSHPTAVVEEEAHVGTGTEIWHFSHVRSGTTIGRNCTFGQNTYVDEQVNIGNNVKVQNNVSIYRGVTLEDYVFCGPSMVFTNVDDPRSSHPRDENDYDSTLVKEGATIGANATIICGHTIGKWSFIGAGAVVTDDVKNHALIQGNPARQHGWACECGNLIRKVEVTSWTCEECGLAYELNSGEIGKVNRD